MEQWVKCSWTDAVAMLGELLHQPEAIYRLFRGVMQNMEFDEVPRKKIQAGSIFRCLVFISSRSGQLAHSSISFPAAWSHFSSFLSSFPARRSSCFVSDLVWNQNIHYHNCTRISISEYDHVCRYESQLSRIQLMNTRRYSLSIALLSAISIVIPPFPSPAQQTGATPLTIPPAVENAIKNYPSITVSQEQINSASAGIDLARTAYLPRVDTLVQVNRATRNNVFGLLLPQGVIPSISGPVIGSNNFGTVWSSAVGGLVIW